MFCDNYKSELRGTLLPFAAEVYLLSKIGGTRRTAEHFSRLLGRKLSRKPVINILSKIRRGEINVTQEDVLRAANKHPISARFVRTAPWLTDPKSKQTLVPEPEPASPAPKPPKRRGRPRKNGAAEAATAVVKVNPVEPEPTGTPEAEDAPAGNGKKYLDSEGQERIKPPHMDQAVWDKTHEVLEKRRAARRKP